MSSVAQPLKPNSVYVIDSSALIDLARWYPADMKIFRPIWDKIEELIVNNRLFSHYEVYREITAGSDLMVDWCKDHKEIFQDIDEEQIEILEKVRTFYDQHYWNTHATQTKPWADPWIVCLAVQIKRGGKLLIKSNVKIVTQENKTKSNRIPSIAKNFGIKSLNLLEFFRDIGIE